MHSRTSFLSAFLLACACSAAHAAELGEARVSSHIGQQLVADVELTTLEDANAKVEVRLASPEVYNGAGIAMPSALSTLNLSVMRRDGRQFVHATTLRPVEADHLHLYLELVEHGQHSVRLATLWLTADPHPAPAVLPAPLSAPLPARVVAPASAPAAVPAVASATAPASAPVPAHLAAEVASVAPSSRPMPPSFRPALASSTPAPPVLASSLASSLPARAGAGARPAACTRPSAQAQACTLLGVKNAELRSRIGQLEERVKGLQARLALPQQGGRTGDKAAGNAPGAVEPPAPALAQPGKSPEAHAAPAPPAPQAQTARPPRRPAGPKPISAIKPLLPHPRAVPPDEGLPWGAIGAGLAVLAAAGAGLALLRARGKRARKAGVPVGRGRLSRLRERFFTHGPAGRAAEPVAEPRLE